MRVFVAGATGVLGLPLVRQLISHGHQVVGLTRTAHGALRIEDLGATAIIGNALDRTALLHAVENTAVDAVIHELTALKKPPASHSDMAATNSLRIQGTANLIDATRIMGARRFVTQSIVFGYGFNDHGAELLTEDSPFGAIHGDAFDSHIAALVSAERQATRTEGIDGVALRYGLFYGGDIEHVAGMLKARRLPVSRHGGELAFVHHEDAASATVAALERGQRGHSYNVVDDVPATFREVLTAIADAREVPHPLPVPQRILELAAPYGGTVLGKVSMRVSNVKARSDLGWTPRFRSYVDGVAAAHL
jgi:nucleoside-diphosphate-sugar epimerase